MGSGIAQLACLGGYETLIQTPTPPPWRPAPSGSSSRLAKGVRREMWSAAEAEEAGGRLEGVADLAGLAAATS